MNLAKKIRLLEKLSAGPQEMPPEAVPVSGPPPGAPAVPAQDEASMPGGDAAGAEEKLTALMETLSSATGDASKFDGGNMRAGVRLRKAALQAAKELKSLRSEVQAVRSGKSEEAAKAKVMQAMEALKSQQQAMPQAPQAPQAPESLPEGSTSAADKLFQPGPGQAAPPQQPKLASFNKEAAKAGLMKRMKKYLGGAFGKQPTTGQRILGIGALGAGLTAGVRGADWAIDSIHGPRQKQKAFSGMMDENPFLKKESPKDVERIFRTLHNFNPQMADDPLVAGSFMRRALQFKEEGIQPQDVKTLVEIGKLRGDTKKKDSLLQAMLGGAAISG